MKWTLGIQLSAVALLVFTGCHRNHSHDGADSHHGHSHGADGGHSDSAQTFSGATHKADGITLLDETRESLGIATTEVQEKMLPRTIRFAARVFDPRNGETALASGLVSKDDAVLLQPGLPVQFRTASELTVTGVIQQVTQPLANAEAEVIVALALDDQFGNKPSETRPQPAHEPERRSPDRLAGKPAEQRADRVIGAPARSGVQSANMVSGKSLPDGGGRGEGERSVNHTNSSPALSHGAFGTVTVSVPGEKTSLVVPREAVIKATNGNLVYVVNGNAYTLTWIELGNEADGWVEVTDGLFEGDSVVTRGAMDLWLVELRAVKGGQGCCPAPPKKGKG